MEDKNAALTYAEVQKAILTFHERWKPPGIDDLPSRLSPMHSKDPVEWARLWAVDGELQRHSRKAGVYFFFDADQNLLYIGSAGGIGRRLNQHENNSSLPQPQYVAILHVPDECWFETWAIEAYLIRELNPPRNKVGRTKGQPIPKIIEE